MLGESSDIRNVIAAASSAMASPTARIFTPTPAHTARYASLQTLHDRLWPLLSQWNRELRAFAEDNLTSRTDAEPPAGSRSRA